MNEVPSTPARLSDRSVDAAEPAIPRLSHRQIFLRFLRFGFLAWGGPVAQIAMVRRELIDDERWISSGRFNRLLAVYQVLPGPEAHELCVHMGMLAGKRLGGFLAGLGFMLPGFVLMFALSWLYFRLDISQSALGPIFLGVQAVVIALIVRAVHRIGEHVVVDRWLAAIALATAGASFLGVSFWITLLASGIIYVLVNGGRFLTAFAAVIGAGLLAWATGAAGNVQLVASAGVAATEPGSVSPLLLFLSGLKAGLLTFGGAYTVIPFLRGDAVGNRWMSDAQFLDGLALSGILPAPLIIFSTFVGYTAGGTAGAIAMTAGIFLPAFSFTLLLHDRLEAVVENRLLHRFLEGVSAGVVGLIAATTVELAATVAQRVPSIAPAVLIFAAGLAVLYLWKAKIAIAAVIFGAGLGGWLLFAG